MPNFRPDTGEGGGGLLLRLLVPSRCREGLALLSPSTYAAQASGCSMWSVPCVARGSSPRVFHKSTDSAAPAFCAFPSLSSSGSQDLTGALSPVRRAFSPPQSQPQFPPAPVACTCPVSSQDPPSGCRPSRISGSLWLETGGLLAVW